MDKKELKKILDDDDLGVLKIKAESESLSGDDRLINSFEEICVFFETNGREPMESPSDLYEFKLYSRLNGIRANPLKATLLANHDRHGLLRTIKQITSVTEIFADDDLGIFKETAADLFNLKHVPKLKTAPDYIARRKRCSNFSEFDQLFKMCQSDLRSKKRRLLPFAKERQINSGSFFVLKGVLLYVSEVLDKNEVRNPRLHCVYENGTESDILRHSLAAALYRDGKRVSEHEDNLLQEFQTIEKADVATGYIYVLRSLSENGDISSIQDLYKIGFSRGDVKERVRNASHETTYLLAPVSIVATYKCFNLNPKKLEGLLHEFFGNACLAVKIKDNLGRECTPREWFIAPLDVIEQSIYLVLSSEITQFKYDRTHKEIVGR